MVNSPTPERPGTGCDEEGTLRKRIGVPVFLIIWLIIGAIAAGQRGLYSNSEPGCNSFGTIIVNILAGPLNYVGVDPEVDCPEAPEPSEQ